MFEHAHTTLFTIENIITITSKLYFEKGPGARIKHFIFTLI